MPSMQTSTSYLDICNILIRDISTFYARRTQIGFSLVKVRPQGQGQAHIVGIPIYLDRDTQEIRTEIIQREGCASPLSKYFEGTHDGRCNH